MSGTILSHAPCSSSLATSYFNYPLWDHCYCVYVREEPGKQFVCHVRMKDSLQKKSVKASVTTQAWPDYAQRLSYTLSPQTYIRETCLSTLSLGWWGSHLPAVCRHWKPSARVSSKRNRPGPGKALRAVSAAFKSEEKLQHVLGEVVRAPWTGTAR